MAALDWRAICVPPVSGRYGAPMGRSPKMVEGLEGRLVPIACHPLDHLRARRLPLREGYDAGGAYWGDRPAGLSLYCVYCAHGALGYYDARSSAEAIAKHQQEEA